MSDAALIPVSTATSSSRIRTEQIGILEDIGDISRALSVRPDTDAAPVLQSETNDEPSRQSEPCEAVFAGITLIGTSSDVLGSTHSPGGQHANLAWQRDEI